MRDLQRRMPWAKFVTSFGATECASNLTLGGADDRTSKRGPTRSAPSLPGMELKIVDPDTARSSGPASGGELVVRGSAVRAVLQGPGEDGRSPSTRTAGSTPATSAGSTPEGRLAYSDG